MIINTITSIRSRNPLKNSERNAWNAWKRLKRWIMAPYSESPHFIYTHIHIICNYNSQCKMRKERRGKSGGCYPPYCIRPRFPVAPPDLCPLHSLNSHIRGILLCLCISYGIVCSNNFNGSRERISFARRSEKKFEENRKE